MCAACLVTYVRCVCHCSGVASLLPPVMHPDLVVTPHHHLHHTAGKSSKEADLVAKARAKREPGAKAAKKGAAAGGGMGGSGAAGGDDGGGPENHLIKRPREYVVHFKFRDPPELAPPILSVQVGSTRVCAPCPRSRILIPAASYWSPS